MKLRINSRKHLETEYLRTVIYSLKSELYKQEDICGYWKYYYFCGDFSKTSF